MIVSLYGIMKYIIMVIINRYLLYILYILLYLFYSL